jgi:hypothetical protein
MLPQGLDGKHRTAATPVQGSKWDLGMSSERIRGADAQYPFWRKQNSLSLLQRRIASRSRSGRPFDTRPTLTKRSTPGEHAAVREGSTAAFRGCGSRTADQNSPKVEFYDLPPDFRK